MANGAANGTVSLADAADARPRIVVIVGTDIAHDALARRESLALVDAGLDVTILRPGSSGYREETLLGEVRILRVPVVWRHRDEADARRLDPRPAGPQAPVTDLRPAVLRSSGRGRSRRYAARLIRGMAGALRTVKGSLWRRGDRLVSRTGVGVRWRRMLPEVADFELAFGPVLDKLEWDALHAHDIQLVEVARQAAGRRLAAGRAAAVIYDAHEEIAGLPVGGTRTVRERAARISLERECLGDENAVVSVPERHVAAGALDKDPDPWDRHAAALRDLYRRLLGSDRVREPVTVTSLETMTERRQLRHDRASVVGLGPANMAGQAWAWAKALEQHVPGLRTEVMSVDRGSPLVFEADVLVPRARYADDHAWARGYEDHAIETWTHALLEAGRPLFGFRHGRDFTGDVPVLRAVGIEVGLLMHGSEIRNPRRHAGSTPWSPFRDPEEEFTALLQRKWDVLHPLVAAFDGPVFVSTPDLLDDVPRATFLPVVVDVRTWSTAAPVMERPRPVVLHAPSRASLKGTTHVEAAMEPLVAEGLIEYRRIEGLAPADMPSVVAGADIVLDQFSLGSYGVMAVQAMIARRVVVGHLTDGVRRAFPHPVPIVEGPPDQLGEVVRGLIADRRAARAAAEAGRIFALEVHGGARSAQVLIDALGLRGV